MLDTHGRKYIQPSIEKIAKVLLNLGLSANDVTVIGLFAGVAAGISIYFEQNILALTLLWVSGLLDVVDGTMARQGNNVSYFGTLMDITFDRIVEIAVILSLSLKNPEITMNMLILTFSILISMTIFLTVGALAKQKGVKSFYYQAGIAERTEGFILFSSMILFQNHLSIIISIFTGLILFTIAQRFLEAKKILS